MLYADNACSNVPTLIIESKLVLSGHTLKCRYESGLYPDMDVVSFNIHHYIYIYIYIYISDGAYHNEN
jgi:hypothetical protein